MLTRLLRIILSPVIVVARFVMMLFRRLFGDIRWTPPTWMTSLRDRLVHPFIVSPITFLIQRCRSHIHAHPRTYQWAGISLLALVIVGTGLGLWYRSLPKPVEFTVQSNNPQATQLVDNAVPENLIIQFSGSAAQLEHVGKPITQGISISPAITGNWQWTNDQVITFTPTEDWAVGQDYNVKFDKSLFPSHVHLDDYRLRFHSEDFSARISRTEFYQDPKNPKIKKIVATINFSHPVDTSDFEKRVELRMPGDKGGLFGIVNKTYPFTVSYNKFKGEAYVHSESLPIPAKDQQMTVAIDSGVRAARGGSTFNKKLQQQVTIPGMYSYFRVQSADLSLARNERFEPEQVMVIQVTAGVLDTELQKNLSIYLLPKNRPVMQDQPERKNYRYHNVQEIGPEILNKATKVELTPLPTDKEYATLHSFKYKAEVGRQLYLKLNKGIESYGGYFLAEVFDKILTVPDFPKELNIMYDGAVLSLSGEKKVSLLSRDIEAVKFQVDRVMPNQINHLVTQSGGLFKSPAFNNYNFSFENIAEHISETRDLKKLEHGKTQYFSYDLAQYLNSESGTAKRGLFFFKVEGVDRQHHNSIGIEDSRLILVTNLGVVVKDNADGSHDVFVQSIQTGQPVAGAQVQVLGKNGIAIANVTTSTTGHASLPSFKDFSREKTPVVYLVKRGDDLSFLPYERSDRQLNYSRFDIGGETNADSSDKLNAYLFSERGIYRPGDIIHVGAMVKSGNWKRSLAGIPLELVFSDARGVEVQKQKIKLSDAGFEEMAYKTEDTSPTGTYQASVYLIRNNYRDELIGSTTVRVEEFLPDRLKITTHLSAERLEGWVTPTELKGTVSLRNLFGTPATDRRVAASISLSPALPVFRRYADYTFLDPVLAKHSFNERLPDQKTNEEGNAEFNLGLERFAKATYRLGFTAEGYEAEGGRSVVSSSGVLVSPLTYLIGYKPDGNLRYITKGSKRNVEIIAIDPALQKISVGNLTGQIVEQRYVSVLMQQSNGTYKYESVLKEIPLRKDALSVTAKGIHFTLPTDQPGDYQLVIRDSDNTLLNKINFSIAGAANLTRSLEKNAELQVKLNKTDYAPGEEIELDIKAPYTGSGLITIERDHVYQHKWFHTTTTSSIQKIRIPEDLDGNGYINVTFLRAMDSPEIFMSPLSYGVAAFSLSRERHVNKVTLTSAEIARPGEPYRIHYHTQQRGKIVVFAVDEGILQVAHYQTPDPLSHYFKKRALEVRTSQILDLILPEFKLTQALSAAGGDQEGLAAIGKNLNPFKRKRDKAVVFWSGIIDSDATERELVYDVPDYFNGTLRVMAVAVAAESMGVADKKTIIRGHFVLSPNVPTTAAPGDEFDVSVGVANNVEGSGKEPEINLELQSSEHLEILGAAKQTLKIGEGRESSTKFRVRAKDKLGSGNLKFIASMADKHSKASVDVSVRPAVPFMTSVVSSNLTSKTIDVAVPRKMWPQYRTNDVNVSALPLSLAHGLVNYLNTYPHLCTEQLVSRAFPAIVLRNRTDFGYAPDKVEATLAQTMRILRARQTPEGSFGFWAANSHVSDIQSVYALHFLTEAKERGYNSGNDLLTNGKNYLQTLANRNIDTLSEARINAYAIYMLTRNGVVTTNALNTLRARLDDKTFKGWQSDLTAGYLAATYKLLKNESAAEKLIDHLQLAEVNVQDYAYLYDSLVRDSQLMYLLARHFPDRLKQVDGATIVKVVHPITEGYFNTISSAYAILGLDAYIDAVGASKLTDKVTVKELYADGKSQPLVLPAGVFPHVGFSALAEKINIKNPNDYPLYYQITQSGYDLTTPNQAIKNRLEVQREYQNSAGKVVTSIPLGEEIEVHIKLRAIEDGDLTNVAIVDLLPGGFEVVMDNTNTRTAQSTNPETPQTESDSEEQNFPTPTRWSSPLTSAKSSWLPEYVDIREDRVVIYGMVDKSAKEYVYKIKATNTGNYVIPPLFAEGMYDRRIQGRSISDKMTVTENK